MGDNSIVKVDYALGSRMYQPKARVPVMQWNLKDIGCRDLWQSFGFIFG